MDNLGVHLSHCNFGENKNRCKYGDEDCPALRDEWSWFGKNLQDAERLRIKNMLLGIRSIRLLDSLNNLESAKQIREAMKELDDLLVNHRRIVDEEMNGPF